MVITIILFWLVWLLMGLHGWFLICRHINYSVYKKDIIAGRDLNMLFSIIVGPLHYFVYCCLVLQSMIKIDKDKVLWEKKEKKNDRLK